LKSLRKLLTALVFATLCASGSSAQQSSQSTQSSQDTNAQGQTGQKEQSTTPVPAYRSPLASAADQSDDTGPIPAAVEPDTRPPAGAQSLSLGAPESRSYYQFHANLVQTGDSDALGQNGGWTTYTSVVGGIDLHKVSGVSDLDLGYLGGGTFSENGDIGNSTVQELSFTEKLTARRAVFSFLDTMAYLPETGFGYGGIGGLSVGGLALQPGLTPEGTILTTRGQQIDNSFITQVDLSLTRRSSLTFLGGYGLLRYFDNNLLNVDNYYGQAGYNHQFNPTDTLSFFYRYSQYSYGGLNQKIHDNVVQASYAKRITGRLAFQIGAGPDYAEFDTPVLNGNGTTTTSSQLTWALSSTVTYQVKRGSLGAGYFHGISGGSGVLSGAISDTVSGNASRQLTRTFSLGINGGYSRSKALAIPGFEIFNTSYNYWFGGATLNHPLGRSSNLFLSYQAQYQDANVGFCIGSSCGGSFLRNLVSAGISWQSRPMLF
jgi:hypothetical protein